MFKSPTVSMSALELIKKEQDYNVWSETAKELFILVKNHIKTKTTNIWDELLAKYAEVEYSALKKMVSMMNEMSEKGVCGKEQSKYYATKASMIKAKEWKDEKDALSVFCDCYDLSHRLADVSKAISVISSTHSIPILFLLKYFHCGFRTKPLCEQVSSSHHEIVMIIHNCPGNFVRFLPSKNPKPPSYLMQIFLGRHHHKFSRGLYVFDVFSPFFFTGCFDSSMTRDPVLCGSLTFDHGEFEKINCFDSSEEEFRNCKFLMNHSSGDFWVGDMYDFEYSTGTYTSVSQGFEVKCWFPDEEDENDVPGNVEFVQWQYEEGKKPVYVLQAKRILKNNEKGSDNTIIELVDVPSIAKQEKWKIHCPLQLVKDRRTYLEEFSWRFQVCDLKLAKYRCDLDRFFDIKEYNRESVKNMFKFGDEKKCMEMCKTRIVDDKMWHCLRIYEDEVVESCVRYGHVKLLREMMKLIRKRMKEDEYYDINREGGAPSWLSCSEAGTDVLDIILENEKVNLVQPNRVFKEYVSIYEDNNRKKNPVTLPIESLIPTYGGLEKFFVRLLRIRGCFLDEILVVNPDKLKRKSGLFSSLFTRRYDEEIVVLKEVKMVVSEIKKTLKMNRRIQEIKKIVQNRTYDVRAYEYFSSDFQKAFVVSRLSLEKKKNGFPKEIVCMIFSWIPFGAYKTP